DPEFAGDVNVARRVHSVLERYGFNLDHVAYDIGGGAFAELDRGVDALQQLPDNVLVRYGDTQGGSVQEIFGPSCFDELQAEDRYVQATTLVLGREWRVLVGGEALCVEPLSPNGVDESRYPGPPASAW